MEVVRSDLDVTAGEAGPTSNPRFEVVGGVGKSLEAPVGVIVALLLLVVWSLGSRSACAGVQGPPDRLVNLHDVVSDPNALGQKVERLQGLISCVRAHVPGGSQDPNHACLERLSNVRWMALNPAHPLAQSGSAGNMLVPATLDALGLGTGHLCGTCPPLLTGMILLHESRHLCQPAIEAPAPSAPADANWKAAQAAFVDRVDRQRRVALEFEAYEPVLEFLKTMIVNGGAPPCMGVGGDGNGLFTLCDHLVGFGLQAVGGYAHSLAQLDRQVQVTDLAALQTPTGASPHPGFVEAVQWATGDARREANAQGSAALAAWRDAATQLCGETFSSSLREMLDDLRTRRSPILACQ